MADQSKPTLPPPIRGARAAFVFFTRLPLGGFPYRDADYAWAPAHAPLVGVVVGAIGALVFYGSFGAGAAAAAMLSLVATMLATGAFHEDGLADSADALGGAIFDRAKLLVILKDSRIGTYGAAALTVSIGLRVALVARAAELGALGLAPVHAGVAAIVLSHVLARVAPTWLMARMPYVTDEEHAKSRPIVRAQTAQAVTATAWALGVTLAAAACWPQSRMPLACTVAVLPVVALVCGWRFHRRAGGITGDFLGATEQVGEMAVLLALVLASA